MGVSALSHPLKEGGRYEMPSTITEEPMSEDRRELDQQQTLAHLESREAEQATLNGNERIESVNLPQLEENWI